MQRSAIQIQTEVHAPVDSQTAKMIETVLKTIEAANEDLIKLTEIAPRARKTALQAPLLPMDAKHSDITLNPNIPAFFLEAWLLKLNDDLQLQQERVNVIQRKASEKKLENLHKEIYDQLEVEEECDSMLQQTIPYLEEGIITEKTLTTVINTNAADIEKNATQVPVIQQLRALVQVAFKETRKLTEINLGQILVFVYRTLAEAKTINTRVKRIADERERVAEEKEAIAEVEGALGKILNQINQMLSTVEATTKRIIKEKLEILNGMQLLTHRIVSVATTEKILKATNDIVIKIAKIKTNLTQSQVSIADKAAAIVKASEGSKTVIKAAEVEAAAKAGAPLRAGMWRSSQTMHPLQHKNVQHIQLQQASKKNCVIM